MPRSVLSLDLGHACWSRGSPDVHDEDQPLIAERTFRNLDVPELRAEVAEGVAYVDGIRVKQPRQAMADERAAA